MSDRVLYLDGATRGILDLDLQALSERHRMAILPPATTYVTPDPEGDIGRHGEAGVLIVAHRGWLGRSHLALAKTALARGARALVYWPLEENLEVMDEERLRSHWKLGVAARAFAALNGGELRVSEDALALTDPREGFPPSPVPFDPERRGPALYARLDYWARFSSGGSYGHTCYVAHELNRAVPAGVTALVTQDFSLLRELGVRQVVLESLDRVLSEETLFRASRSFRKILRPVIDAVAPSFIYERLVLGNSALAGLAYEFKIPYVVEYNGSEMSIAESFGATPYKMRNELLAAEKLAFDQATLVSVVSEHVARDLVERGVSAEKILVNPNAADPHAYQPGTPEERASLRAELGVRGDGPVIGFSGTFGGWHGIDVLAAALAPVLDQCQSATFLLIGDGNFKHLVDEAIARHQLQERVICAGRVEHQEGARLLKVCDVLVSPHSKNMGDRPFFGSPTKLFEYMAMGAGIVASDLEQIGEVLRPAILGPAATNASIKDERAILCRPGSVEDFVAAVVLLCERPDLRRTLGANARAALLEHFTWEWHVTRLLSALKERGKERPLTSSSPSPAASGGNAFERIATGDRDKEQAQDQWNADPCGSHYAEDRGNRLQYFKDVERYRYVEYAPWMPKTMEFGAHSGKSILEIGAGMGTDLAQFAQAGSIVTDIDLSRHHLELARENFALRGLSGTFVHHDAEKLPFDDGTFDLVYSNGVIHHTPNTPLIVSEIRRVLKPGGRAIVMVYAESSWYYWTSLVWSWGLQRGLLQRLSIGEIMSRVVERSSVGQRPLVKVYTSRRLRGLFGEFDVERVLKRQFSKPAFPPLPFSGDAYGWLWGWNLVIKARKPARP